LVKLDLRRRHFENTRLFFILTLNFARLNLASGANYQRKQKDGVLKIMRFLTLNRQGDGTDMGWRQFSGEHFFDFLTILVSDKAHTSFTTTMVMWW
jgi:hypothetical protein